MLKACLLPFFFTFSGESVPSETEASNGIFVHSPIIDHWIWSTGRMVNYSENPTTSAPLPLLSPTMSTWIVLGAKAGLGNKLPELWRSLVFTYEQNVGELRDEQCVHAPWRSHYVQLGLQHGRAQRPWNMASLLWYDVIWSVDQSYCISRHHLAIRLESLRKNHERSVILAVQTGTSPIQIYGTNATAVCSDNLRQKLHTFFSEQ